MHRLCSLRSRALLVFGFLLLGTGALHLAPAQTTEDSPVSVGDGTLDVGALLQADAYLGDPAGDAFRARSTRLRLGGEVNTLQYVIQTDFSSSSVLLDAFARLPLTNRLRLTAGLFKAPFSAEVLTSRPDILFAERARIVNTVAPNRQAGVTLGGPVLPNRLSVTVGAFNGTRGLTPNDNDHFLYVGRVQGQIPVGEEQLRVGTNAAYSVDDDVNLSGLGRPNYAGTRFLFGVDARLETDRWLVEGELDAAALDPDAEQAATTASSDPVGFYLAGGIDVAPEHQLLARFDQFDPDVPTQVAPDDQFTLGYNYEPSSVLRILLNYQTPADELSDGFFTARLQVAL
jgi:phosphate-selective porin